MGVEDMGAGESRELGLDLGRAERRVAGNSAHRQREQSDKLSVRPVINTRIDEEAVVIKALSLDSAPDTEFLPPPTLRHLRVREWLSHRRSAGLCLVLKTVVRVRFSILSLH